MKNSNDKIDKYSSLILKWNQVHNLIAKSTETEIQNRHIEDSLQILKLLPEKILNLTDFGSGAGLPAIPIAILRADIKNINLFESVGKKANFLKLCEKELGLNNLNIVNERIEQYKNPEIADVITARAFANLLKIFEISKNYYNEKTNFILLKGRKIDEEIKIAQRKFSFDHQLKPSSTGDGFIFVAKNVKAK